MSPLSNMVPGLVLGVVPDVRHRAGLRVNEIAIVLPLLALGEIPDEIQDLPGEVSGSFFACS